jgi:glycosyltransferase involved in cell wall biosynthesis
VTAPVHTIPHGVRTDVFRPSPGCRHEPRRQSILLVGTYLRDWPAARRIVRQLTVAGVGSVVLGVASEQLHVDDRLVELGPRVSEAELVRHYDEAVALLLPVLDGTASNALLEAMSAGCPVVCPRLPAMVEFLGDDEDCYPPGDEDVAVARILSYVRNPAARRARSAVLRRRAKRFDWAWMRAPLEAVYRSHQGHGSRSTGTYTAP